MISLKRNGKGELVEATGLRSTASSMYTPNQTETFRVSRSKFNDFLTCQRCFYLDRVKGLVSPSTPGWTLNETTDLLLKREFDLVREQQVPHRVFEQFGLTHVVPFSHEDLDLWRDSLRNGLHHQIENSNIVLHGGVDDIWLDQEAEKIIIVDYKSQASNTPVTTQGYLAGVYHEGYKIQMDVYAYLLTQMGFDVSPSGYFYVCNADRSAPSFSGQLVFEETLVPYAWNVDWIETKVHDMINVLNSTDIPDSNPSCENCAYSHQRANIEARQKK